MDDLDIALHLIDELSEDQIKTLMRYEQPGADDGSIEDYKKSLKLRLAIRMAPQARFVEVVAFLAVIAGVIVTHRRYGTDLNMELENEKERVPGIDKQVQELLLDAAKRVGDRKSSEPKYVGSDRQEQIRTDESETETKLGSER